jgi:hypothetical protein
MAERPRCERYFEPAETRVPDRRTMLTPRASSSLGFSNSMQQEVFRSANRGRCIGAQSRERRDRCPLRFKGVGFLVSSRDSLVLVVLSRMPFGISNYSTERRWPVQHVFPSFVGLRCFMPCATLFVNNCGWPNSKIGLNGQKSVAQTQLGSRTTDSRTYASEKIHKIVLLVSRAVKRLMYSSSGLVTLFIYCVRMTSGLGTARGSKDPSDWCAGCTRSGEKVRKVVLESQ